MKTNPIYFITSGLFLGLVGCEHDTAPPPAPAPAPVAAATSASASASASASTSASTNAPRVCDDAMLLVEGAYCPRVQHKCLRHTKEYDEEQERRAELKAQGLKLPMSRISERCLVYQKPGTCLSTKRREMRFCMDRYEWPNVVGEKPALLVTWIDATAACETAGKRLCTADEFNFACEGEEMLPYSYGYERDAERCNIDKPYVAPKKQLMPHALCMEREWCKAHLAELDQRVAIGSTPKCTSPFGVFDLNGNVNEWVRRPREKRPTRSGLKGGWWGPARSRCRPMVTIHKEMYAGYEVGFRCCKDAPQ